jgi:short subunit dehydrogenase-like uncharacterized protein
VPDFLLYGATGYTGALVARAAVERGLRPRLAGRDGARLGRFAGELGLEWAAFGLDDAAALDAALDGVPAVLHCAGPFRNTSRPMVDACVRRGVHYLDLAGEVGVLEALAARDDEARAAGVMLLPGVGFDLVPTDCLAAHLKVRLPSAIHLAVAVQHPSWRDTAGQVRGPTASHGTLATLLDGQLPGGLVRRDGALVPVPLAARSLAVDLGAGPAVAAQFPLGELAALYRSTGIPNIEAYVVLPAAARLALRWLGSWLARLPLDGLLPPGGPNPEELAATRSLVWAEARDDAGRVVTGRLRTPGAYAFTVESALACLREVARGRAPAGYQTPSTAFGADFVLGIDGVERWEG